MYRQGRRNRGGDCNFVYIVYSETLLEFEFESGFDALSASKAIFRARTYSRITLPEVE